jgi:RimJ/RimL family protein N-acetyltransferase
VLREQRTGGGLCFAIVAPGSSEAIGQIRLFNWSPTERVAEVGYWIRRSSWGRGYGTDAVRLACRAGFTRMRLHRIVALVVAENIASSRVLEKVGFRREGRQRSAARVGRGWADVLEYALLRSEFRRTSSR